MSDPAASDRPELTRSDYDRLIALLRASQPDQEQEAITTCRELDKQLHGIGMKLDQMQQANISSFNIMQRVFIGAAFLTIACFGYLFVTTSQMSVALERVEGRFDVVDMRFVAVGERFNGIDNRLDAMDKRLDAMDEHIDKRFEQIDRRLDNIVDLVGQLRPIKQQGIVDQQ